MFGIFKKKTEKEKLNDKYKLLMKDAFDLSGTNRKESDLKYGEAEDILKQIEQMQNS